MKKIVFALMVLSISQVALTADNKKVCEKLYAQAEENCTEAMCEEFGGVDECPIDGDFQVGLQVCVTEGEFESVIKAYNKKNPTKKVKCEDM